MKTPSTLAKQKEVEKILHRIFRTLKNPPNTFPNIVLKKRLRECSGWTNKYKTVAFAMFADVIPTVIHECLHIIYPDWCETKVERYEGLIKRYIKMRDVIKLFKLFANLL